MKPTVGARANDQGELLDVLDEFGRPTGVRMTRREVHERGEWHRAIHIWVVRGEASVLLQKRSLEKVVEPGALDVTVGGHYRAGELFIDAIREAEEEIGLTLRPGMVEYLGEARTERHYPDATPPLTDREFQEVYVTRDERRLSEYRLNVREVEALFEVPLERAIRLFASGDYTAATGYDAMRRPVNALLHEGELPRAGRALHAESLRRVLNWVRGAPAEEIAARPYPPCPST